MIWLKILLPAIVLAAGIIQVLLELKWHDKRTKAHRRTRMALITTMCLVTGLTIALSVNDHFNSERQSRAFEKLQENFDGEAVRSLEREKEAYNQRAELRIQLSRVQDQLTPFVEIARARHPGLGDEAALERLSTEVKSLRADSERISGDLEALRRFASVAQLGPLGVTGMAGAGLKESTPISRVLEGAYLQRDGKAFPRCDKQSLEKFAATATGHPDFPFSHYALAVCNKRLGSDEWKRHAERAVSIFSQTVRIAGHARSHDQAYAELKTYLEEGR